MPRMQRYMRRHLPHTSLPRIHPTTQVRNLANPADPPRHHAHPHVRMHGHAHPRTCINADSHRTRTRVCKLGSQGHICPPLTYTCAQPTCWFLTGCVASRSYSGDTGMPAFRSRSPWQKNSSVTSFAHCRHCGHERAGLLMSTLCRINLSSSVRFSSFHLRHKQGLVRAYTKKGLGLTPGRCNKSEA